MNKKTGNSRNSTREAQLEALRREALKMNLGTGLSLVTTVVNKQEVA